MGRRLKFDPYAWSLLASTFAFAAALAWTGASHASTAEGPRQQLQRRFAGTIRPFLQTFCISCHGKSRPQAQLDLTAYTGLDEVARDYPRWFLLQQKLAAQQMPPPYASKQPS